MDTNLIINILVAAVSAGTPFVFAGLGELVCEKSGVLNLGVEGMMLVGAVTAFIVMAETNNPFWAVSGGILAGICLSLVFAFLTLTLRANQVASGLALSIFGAGLSSFLGHDYTGTAIDGIRELPIPLLSDIPVVGKLFFSFDPLVYLSLVLFLAVYYFIYHSRKGLLLRGIGESPDAAHSLGYNVVLVRYLAVVFGGGMAGLAGAYLSTAYTPMWVENMVAGRGWVALALVVFAAWRPVRLMVGAYLFGLITIVQFHAQGLGVEIPSQLLSMLPYLATILVLVLISRKQNEVKLNAPASLGKPYHPEVKMF